VHENKNTIFVNGAPVLEVVLVCEVEGALEGVPACEAERTGDRVPKLLAEVRALTDGTTELEGLLVVEAEGFPESEGLALLDCDSVGLTEREAVPHAVGKEEPKLLAEVQALTDGTTELEGLLVVEAEGFPESEGLALLDCDSVGLTEREAVPHAVGKEETEK
jgi:hypothetical protein